MPNIKSAKKRVKTSERNRLKNASQLSSLRTAIRAVREAADAKNATDITAKLPEAFSKIDKAVKANVIHKNAGARLKSRLVARTRTAQAA